MLHDLLVASHAVTATVSLAAGIMVVARHRFWTLYLMTLVTTVVTLAAAVGVAWQERPIGTNLLFGGLVVLGVAMIRCAVVAMPLRPAPSRPTSQRFLDLIGFTLISLFDGFVIVAVLTRGGPAWLALVTAVAAVLIGRSAMHRLGSGGANATT